MKKGLVLLLLGAMVVACSRVPITNRKQVNLLPESQMIAMSLEAYGEFLNTNNVVSDSDSRTRMVKRCGEKIKNSVESYLRDNGHGKRIDGFEWEFNLVDDDLVNAWAMPGGKVVVYTGLLDVAQDEKGLAVVMGHEIAHAIARHGNERMSQQLLLQAGGVTLSVLMNEKPEVARDLFLLSYGVAGGLGSLAFSRSHESESDKMGLIFMAMAGYNPQEAPAFWERMSAGGGPEPPEFLSTHPNHDTRIANLEAYMPEAMKYYND